MLALIVAAACRPTRHGESERPAPQDPAVRNPAVAVVVHSWTGRTAAVAEEIAAMLGGRLVRFAESPFEADPHAIPEETVAALRGLDGVRDLYVGFPIWSEEPSAPIRAAMEHLSLAGVRVIPFYTFLHHVRPDALAAFRSSLEARGARVEPEMAFRLRMSASVEEALREARRAVLHRSELWAAAGPDGRGTCRDGRCAVPAGHVWIGDTGPDAPPGAPPPRLHRVDAFVIDEGEVTVAAYRRCAAAGACPALDVGSSICRELVTGDDGRPQPCVSFPESEAYCRWDDAGRLPTEAEWMRAARGRSTAVFPWGDAFELQGAAARGNFGEKPSTGHAGYATVAEGAPWPVDGYPGLAPRCAFPAGRSPFGVCDLAGNLAEWAVSDGTAGEREVVLGGSWLDGEATAFRLGLRFVSPVVPPAVAHGRMGSYLVGFRCVRAAR